MAARIYRLTAAGREAWEGEDAAVPADYRRILWMMDLHGSAPETLAKVFPAEMLEEWLSELEELGMLPIVMLPAKNESADIGRGLVLGADGYVTKPYTKNLIVDVIRRALKHE